MHRNSEATRFGGLLGLCRVPLAGALRSAAREMHSTSMGIGSGRGQRFVRGRLANGVRHLGMGKYVLCGIDERRSLEDAVANQIEAPRASSQQRFHAFQRNSKRWPGPLSHREELQRYGAAEEEMEGIFGGALERCRVEPM